MAASEVEQKKTPPQQRVSISKWLKKIYIHTPHSWRDWINKWKMEWNIWIPFAENADIKQLKTTFPTTKIL